MGTTMAKLGDDIGAIWIATNARTGSMWTTNVAREIVRAKGFEPFPETRSVRERETLAYGVRHVPEGLPSHAARRTPGSPALAHCGFGQRFETFRAHDFACDVCRPHRPRSSIGRNPNRSDVIA